MSMKNAIFETVLNDQRRVWLDPDDAMDIVNDVAALLEQGEPEGKRTRHVSLSYMSSGDTRKPRTMRLMVQDEDWTVEAMIDLSEHDFAALLAGQSLTVECEL